MEDNKTNVIKYLINERSRIVFESDDDEGAMEYYAHLTDVIDQLKANTMTIVEASESLGINLAE